jgi:hypothetical protein
VNGAERSPGLGHPGPADDAEDPAEPTEPAEQDETEPPTRDGWVPL